MSAGEDQARRRLVEAAAKTTSYLFLWPLILLLGGLAFVVGLLLLAALWQLSHWFTIVIVCVALLIASDRLQKRLLRR